jgi:hypothetical protein
MALTTNQVRQIAASWAEIVYARSGGTVSGIITNGSGANNTSIVKAGTGTWSRSRCPRSSDTL